MFLQYHPDVPLFVGPIMFPNHAFTSQASIEHLLHTNYWEVGM